MKKLGLIVLITFYAFAGINHFWHPHFYLSLIPDYLPFHEIINLAAGVAEVLLALGMCFHKTRPYAVHALIYMLVLFIPSHIHFIQLGACAPEGLCTPLWVAWLRLVLVHPLLIWWVWLYRKYEPSIAGATI